VTDTLAVDGLTYELRRSPRRATIGITVDRDGSLILTAPEGCPEATIEETARKKQMWVQTKLAEKRLLFRPRPEGILDRRRLPVPRAQLPPAPGGRRGR
jgi:predicted metal-dependent hydrolase